MKVCKPFFCMLVLCCVLQQQMHADGQGSFKEVISFVTQVNDYILPAPDKKITFTLRQLLEKIPHLKVVKLPASVVKLLDSVEFQLPRVKINKDTYEIAWDDALVFGIKSKLPTRLYVGPGRDGGDWGVSLSIGLPGKNTINTLLPEIQQNMLMLEEKALPENIRTALKKAKLSIADFAKIVDWVELENLALILSTKFVDPAWGKLAFGLNTSATLRFKGPLEQLTNFFGKDLTTIQAAGFVSSDLTGSEIRAIVPGKLTLFRWPLDDKTSPFLHIGTGGYQMRIGLTATGVLTIKYLTALDVKLPFQNDYISFNGSLDVLPLTVTGPALELAGWMDGMIYNMFGLPGLNVGNFGFGITFSLASLAAGGAPTSLSGKGEVHIGPLKRDGILLVDLTKTQVALMVHAGAMSNTDIVDYVVQVMDASAKLLQKKLDVTALKALLYKATPPFSLSDLKFYFVPVSAEIFDAWYESGIHIKGGIEIFGVGGGLELSLRNYSGLIPSLKGKAYLKELSIPQGNPVVIISGAGQNMKRGDADDGPVFVFEASPERQISYLDGFLKIPVLGIESDTRFVYKLNGMECDLKTKLGGAFDSELHIRTDITSLNSWIIRGVITQQGLSVLGGALQAEAKKFSEKSQKDLSFALGEVKKWETQAYKDIDAWVAQEVAKVNTSINGLTAALNRAKARCDAVPWWDVIKRVPACQEIVMAGPWWLLDLGVLSIHRDVTLKGVAREVAKGGVKFASTSAQVGLNTAKASVEVARATTDFVGKVMTGGLNITEVTFDGSLKELGEKGVLPQVKIVGTILGKPFNQTYQVDFTRPGQLPMQVIAGLVQVFGPQPQPYQRVIAVQ